MKVEYRDPSNPVPQQPISITKYGILVEIEEWGGGSSSSENVLCEFFYKPEFSFLVSGNCLFIGDLGKVFMQKIVSYEPFGYTAAISSL